MTRAEFGTEDYRRHAALFNDVTYAPTGRHILFSDRLAIAEYLWDQGWRRDVRPEDITRQDPIQAFERAMEAARNDRREDEP